MENEEVIPGIRKPRSFFQKAKDFGSQVGRLALGAVLVGGFYTAIYAVTKVGSMAVDSAIDSLTGSSSSNEENGNEVVDNVPVE